MSATLPTDVPTGDASSEEGSRNASPDGTFLERWDFIPSYAVPGALPGLTRGQTHAVAVAVVLYLVWRYAL